MSIAKKTTSILKRDVFLYVSKIVTSIVIARQLGPEAFGIYSILLLIPSYAESFGRLKFDLAAVYFLGKKKYSISEVIYNLNILSLISSFLIVGLVLWKFELIYELLFSKTKYDASLLLYFILLQIPLQFLLNNYVYIYIHKEDIVTYNHIIIIQAIVSSILITVFLFFTKMGLWAVLISIIFSTMLALIYGVFNLKNLNKVCRKINVMLIKDLFRYGFKLYVGGLISHFQGNISNLLIVIYLTPAQVAFFSIARIYSQMIDKVPSTLNTILLSRLPKVNNLIDEAFLTTKAVKILFIILIKLSLLVSLLIYPAVLLFYGDGYLSVVFLLLILIPGILFAGATAPIMQFFLSNNRADLGITLPLLPLIFQIILAVEFIPTWSAFGAAIALSLSLILLSIINIAAFVCFVKSAHLKDFIIKKEDYKYLYQFLISELKFFKNYIPFRKI